MALYFVREDIVTMQVDAIVNAANEKLWKGGGVCGAIFLAAGAEALQAECCQKAPCPTGGAVITKGYALPAKYIIHAVGPRWRGGNEGERELLAGAYRSALALAREYRLQSIAFPLISAGIYGYPKEEALQVAVETIRGFLEETEAEDPGAEVGLDVYLTLFGPAPIRVPSALAELVEQCPEEWENLRYQAFLQSKAPVEAPSCSCAPAPKPGVAGVEKKKEKSRFLPSFLGSPKKEILCNELRESSVEPEDFLFADVETVGAAGGEKEKKPRKLEDLLGQMPETFAEMLLRLIDEKGYSDVEVYKRANLDRKLFSKIRSNRDYVPKKTTVLAFAIALRLSEDETVDILNTAGYAFSGSRKQDVIVLYYIREENYDIDRINETLFYYDQSLLGSAS